MSGAADIVLRDVAGIAQVVAERSSTHVRQAATLDMTHLLAGAFQQTVGV